MTDALLRTKAVTENVLEDYPEVPSTSPAGPKKTAKGFARDIIAEKDGVKSETVRMREYREAHRKPVLTDIGMEMDPEWLAKVRVIQMAVDAVARLLSMAKGKMKTIMEDTETVPGRYKDLLSDLETLQRRVAWARPESLCPACKGLEKVTPGCAGCETLAWITKGQVQDVPKELWDEKEPKVNYEGKRVPVSTFFRGAPDGPTADEEKPPW